MSEFQDKLRERLLQSLHEASDKSVMIRKPVRVNLISDKELYGDVAEVGEDYFVLKNTLGNAGTVRYVIRRDQVSFFY